MATKPAKTLTAEQVTRLMEEYGKFMDNEEVDEGENPRDYLKEVLESPELFAFIEMTGNVSGAYEGNMKQVVKVVAKAYIELSTIVWDHSADLAEESVKKEVNVTKEDILRIWDLSEMMMASRTTLPTDRVGSAFFTAPTIAGELEEGGENERDLCVKVCEVMKAEKVLFQQSFKSAGGLLRFRLTDRGHMERNKLLADTKCSCPPVTSRSLPPPDKNCPLHGIGKSEDGETSNHANEPEKATRGASPPKTKKCTNPKLGTVCKDKNCPLHFGDVEKPQCSSGMGYDCEDEDCPVHGEAEF